MDESDPKLKEFLGLMLPKSHLRTLPIPSSQEGDIEEPPKKLQAIELPEAESDEEYEMVPQKSKKEHQPTALLLPSIASAPDVLSKVLEQERVPIPVGQSEDVPVTEINATDDDWLRSRTSRLLDLVEPTNLATLEPNQEEPNASTQTDESLPVESNDPVGELMPVDEIANDAEIQEDLDHTVEAIKASGRLFVRNLPYTATEDELRKYFAAHGALEEVTAFYSLFLGFMMNIQIGTAYAFEHVIRAGRIF